MPAHARTASVVIPCYNYGRFVGEAIASALDQSFAPLEVIVVDDGSTDDSRAVIGRFGERVRAVHQANGGHAAAMNAGCRLARGELVFLLDADDVLLPDAIERVAGGWHGEEVMTHGRLVMMDANGMPLAGTVPAPWVRLDEGDVRERLLARGSFSSSVTSGLSFRRGALERVLPIPEARFRQGADGYLVRAIGFLGAVRRMEEPVARYRRHGENDSTLAGAPGRLALGLRKRMVLMTNEFESVRELAARHGLVARPHPERADPDFTAFRLCSRVLDPAAHPFEGDTPLRLLPDALAATARARFMPWSRRLFSIVMACGVALLPPIAARLAAFWQAPGSRPRWLRRQSAREAMRVNAT